MSRETVICPKCQAEVSVDVTTTISSTDTAALTALAKGELNTCDCPQCHAHFCVSKPLIYRDAERPFLAFCDDVSEGDLQAMEEQVDTLASAMAEQNGIEKPVVRLTTNPVDFIEKINLWRLGFDDRLIEFAKQQLYRNTDLEKMNRLQHRLLVDFSNEDESKLAFLIYDRETNAPCGGIHVPREEYDKLLDEFNSDPRLLDELERLFPSSYVSVERLF